MQHRDSGSPDPPDKHGRKRVGKACDRCRQKKSKCDGSLPCNRCRADNQQCIFGERKRAPDKVHPKGYTEALESNNKRLTDGLWELYALALKHEVWPGDAVERDDNDNPCTHDILASLGVLQHYSSPPSPEMLSDDHSDARQSARQQSISSDSERSFSCSSRNSSLPTPPAGSMFMPGAPSSHPSQFSYGSRPLMSEPSDPSMFMSMASSMEDPKAVDPMSTVDTFGNPMVDFLYGGSVIPFDPSALDYAEDNELLWGSSRC